MENFRWNGGEIATEILSLVSAHFPGDEVLLRSVIIYLNVSYFVPSANSEVILVSGCY